MNFQAVLTEGKALLQAFSDSLPEDDNMPVAIEEPFVLEIDGLDIPIIGVMDLVEEDEAGTIIIGDYKTCSKAFSTNEVNKNFQLTMYHLAARRNGYADREILLRFDCLIKTKVPKFKQFYTTRTEIDEIRAIRKIHEVWKGIQSGIFIPNDQSWKCNWCEHKRFCTSWFLSDR